MHAKANPSVARGSPLWSHGHDAWGVRYGATVGALAGALHGAVSAAIIAWRYRAHILAPPVVGQDTSFDPGSRLLGFAYNLPGNFLQHFYAPGLLAKLPLVAELVVVNVLVGVGLGILAGLGVRLIPRAWSAMARAGAFLIGFLALSAVLHALALLPLLMDQRRSKTLRHYVGELARRLVTDGGVMDLILTAVIVVAALWLVRRVAWSWNVRVGMAAAASMLLLIFLAATSGPNAAVGAIRGASTTQLAHQPRNVVLISIDSLRADHLGCYGYHRATSPVLDRLAAEGVRFATAYTVSPWTLPSHATMLTGRYPLSHGAVTANQRISSATPTLATIFKRAGYVTAGFVSYEFLRRRYGFNVGFDHFDDFTTDLDTEAEERTARTGPLLNAQIIPWIEAQDRPFFLFIHYFDVHWDYDPPPPFDTMFDPDYTGPDVRPFLNNPAIHLGMPKRHLEHFIALYDGEIRFTDQIVGDIMTTMDRLGIGRDTLLIVTADHGDEFFEHGNTGHTKSLYDEVMKVPLIVRWPRGLAGGRVVTPPVSLVDLAPTVYDLAGLPAPEGLEGQSLVPLLLGKGRRTTLIFGHLMGHKRLYNWAMVRQGNDKYLHHLRMPHAELYDLTADPGEQSNRLGDHDGEVLGGPLLAWLRQQWAAYRQLPKQEHQIVVDSHNTERLRALGYIE